MDFSYYLLSSINKVLSAGKLPDDLNLLVEEEIIDKKPKKLLEVIDVGVLKI